MKQYLPVKILVLLFILSTIKLNAQETTPLLSGKVIISIKEGTFDCDLTLSDIPRIKDYYIRLNSGMNILNFRSKKPNDFLINYDKSFTDTLSSGESNAYYFADNTGKSKFLPETLELKYVGKFPVIKDTLNYNYSRQDWRGNIAFNSNSLRTDGMQSAWYPVLYDIKKDKKYASVRYDIEISCKDCSTLYLNGSKPFQGTETNFKSNTPQELTMFLGNYETKNINGTYILNSDIDDKQMEEFGNMTNAFKKYYETHLKILYNQDITYICSTPVSLKNAWQFVSYPTIAIMGHGNHGLKGMFEEKKGIYFKPYIAHELGHYYFGFYKNFNTELGGMMSEGFSEYLSLKAAKELLNENVYKTKLEDKIKVLKTFKAIPFVGIKTSDDFKNRNTYVYTYAPILFVAIEKEIGEKKMWQWMNTILQTPTDFTNYDFLMSTLKITLKNDKQFENIINTYFNSEKSIENAINKIEEK